LSGSTKSSAFDNPANLLGSIIKGMAKDARRSNPNLETCAVQSGQSALESRVPELLKFAEKEDRLDVLASFRVEFLTYCIVDRQQTPADVWKGLKTCVDSYAILKHYEEHMDHAKFVDYLRTELGTLSGNTKDGRPIVWLKAQNNSYKLKNGSSEVFAFFRAHIWMMEIARLKAGAGVEVQFIIDDSRRKMLDFNFSMLRELMLVAISLNPFCNDKTMVFGASRAFRTFWNLTSEVLGHRRKQFSFPDKKDDARDVVENISDIPAWWMSSDQQAGGTLSRNSLWEWERCLERGRRTTTAKDIFNPDKPWVIVEETEFLQSSTEKETCLEAIAESDDEF
jgi:CRAL/TRIO domain